MHDRAMNEVVITGIGLVSSHGEGISAHRNLYRKTPVLESARFAPYSVHPLAPIDFDTQIPKKSDQRQMEPWQRIGVHAAGLALDHAGLKDRADLKAQMHLIVAAGGGERDYAVDGQILAGLKTAPDPDAFLNERLMGDLRPTLFLAQLSNLLAGNIAIVHGVTGASRTFMGEEQAGVDALRIAHARIASGQNALMLVGGSFHAERPDILLVHELGGVLWKGSFRSVWERGPKGGFVPGSGGAFLVLESRAHAVSRGATCHAVLSGVAASQTRREAGRIALSLKTLAQEIGLSPGAALLSGCCGIATLAREEQDAFGTQPEAIQDAIGHLLEAQAPFAVGLAVEKIGSGQAQDISIVSVGHRRGEGVIRVSACKGDA
jgi:3-oxoacyl-[acyl-carrier-protein] synthase II